MTRFHRRVRRRPVTSTAGPSTANSSAAHATAIAAAHATGGGAGHSTARRAAFGRLASGVIAAALAFGALPPTAAAAVTGSSAGASVDAPGAPGTTHTGVVPAAFASHGPQVFGFLPYWMLGQANIRYDVLTTIAYFGLDATAAGHLRTSNADGSPTAAWAGWTSPRMTSIIRSAHHSGARVVLTVQLFAWNGSQRNRQVAVLGSPARRARLASEIVAAVRARGADGVNLDFEPIARGQRANFVGFVRTLKAKLRAVRPTYELTVDTTASIGNYDVTRLTARGAADAVVVMGYDYRLAGDDPGSVAPLSRPGYDLRDTIRAYRARTGASKIILGLPWYGRAWSTTSKAVTAASANPAKYGFSVTANYSLAVALARTYGRHYLASEATAWTRYQRTVCSARYGCVTVWRKLFFDDARSLAAKSAVIRRARLRGTAIWALGFEGDERDLWSVYARAYPKP